MGKSHLTFARAVSWDDRVGKLHSRAELLCSAQQCCCWLCFAHSVMEVLDSLRKSRLLKKEKNFTNP